MIEPMDLLDGDTSFTITTLQSEMWTVGGSFGIQMAPIEQMAIHWRRQME